MITIADDGRGIDPQKIKKSALEKGVITVEQAENFTDREAIELIWAPGFSSSQEVSDVSGRGVGMDVVRSEITALNGYVEIESKVGLGTRLTLTMPMSTAIIQSLLIKHRDAIYAIPRNSIQEVLVIYEGDRSIERVNDVEMIRYRGQLFPIIHLADVLGEKRVFYKDGEMVDSRRETLSERRQNRSDEEGQSKERRSKTSLTVLMIKVNKSLYGLGIEESLMQEETVVKPINEVIRQRYHHFMGTTILSDGRVSFIIDPLGVANKARLSFLNNKFEFQKETQVGKVSNMESFLIFKAGGGECLSIMANLVEFTSEIQRSDILSAGEKEFVSLHGKEYLLVYLNQLLNLKSDLPIGQEQLYVVIPKYVSSNIAFLTHEVVGIERIASDKDYTVKNEKGLLGAVLWEGQMLMMLDVYGIDDILTGHVYEEGRSSKSILMVEDFPIFQRIVKDHITSFGYRVVVAEDGEVALSKLQTHHFDLIVSDLEMPVKDGFQLCREVKDSEKYSNIPIVALTSLDNDAAREKAKAAGFDDYLVKVNRGEFYRTLNKYLKGGEYAF